MALWKTRLQPLKNVWQEFFHAPAEVTLGRVQVRDALSLKRIMATLVLTLLPCIGMALWNTGYQRLLAMQGSGIAAPSGWRDQLFNLSGLPLEPSATLSCLLLGMLHLLPILLVCWLGAFFWEALFAVVRRLEINEGWGVTGLLLALILPPAIPLWQVFLGISFGTVLGKEIFGGTGRNFLNPALTGYAFLFFAYPTEFSGDGVYLAVDGVSAATPLVLAAEGGLAAVRESYSWWQAFVGTIPGSLGETSALACLLGALLLLYTGVAAWRTMLACLLGAFGIWALLFFFGSATNPLFELPFHWHLVLGSFAFGVVFMATDPVSSALTEPGKWAYGLLVGAMLILVRVLNPAFVEGTMLAILFGNIFAPLIDRLVLQAQIKRRRLHYGQ